MSSNLENKKQAVSEIAKKIQDAQSVVVVNYSGLNVEKATALRAQFRANNVEYVVLKNTLVRRALEELKIEGMDEVLNGPSAFAFGMSDPVSPAKILNDFITKTKTEALSVKAGLMDNAVMSSEQVKELASIPSRNELLARLMGSMQSGVASLVRVLDAIAKKTAEAVPAAVEAVAEAAAEPAPEAAPAEA